MENDFSDRLNQLLSDPDMMGKVLDAAKNVMGAVGEVQGTEEAPSAENTGADGKEPLTGETGTVSAASSSAPLSLLSRDPEHDEERIRFIKALCPFLSRSRREAAESLIRVLSVMRVMRLDGAGKGGNG